MNLYKLRNFQNIVFYVKMLNRSKKSGALSLYKDVIYS